MPADIVVIDDGAGGKIRAQAVTDPSGAGGGGPATIANGADVALGSTTDAAVDTDTTGTVSGKLRGLVKLFVNFLDRLPAALTGSGNLKTAVQEALPAGENHIGATGGHTVQAQATLTRPADTALYTANDAVANNTTAGSVTPLEWTLARVSGGGVTIQRARLITSKASMTARFRLWLFTSSPTVTAGDNAAFAVTLANADARIGYIDFSTIVSGSDCTDYYGTLVTNGPAAVVPAATKIYGLLQTLDGWTPDSGQSFKISLAAYQD